MSPTAVRVAVAISGPTEVCEPYSKSHPSCDAIRSRGHYYIAALPQQPEAWASLPTVMIACTLVLYQVGSSTREQLHEGIYAFMREVTVAHLACAQFMYARWCIREYNREMLAMYPCTPTTSQSRV